MGQKGFVIAGIVFGSLALLVIGSALGTSHWMQGCIPMTDYFKFLSHFAPAGSDDSLSSAQSMFAGKKMCINLGVVTMSMDILSYHVNVALPASSMDTVSKIVAGSVIIAVLLMFIAVILLIVSACSQTMNVQKRASASTNSRIGTILFVIACFLVGVGAVTYTITNSNVVHHPMKFVTAFGSSSQNVFKQMMSQSNGQLPSDTSSLYGGNGATRKRRQSEDIGNLPRLEQHGMSDNTMHSPDLKTIQKETQALFSRMDPNYGYSFYLLWAGFVIALLASVFAFMGSCRKGRLEDDMAPLPVL